jgi:hypothetical protein
MKFLGSINIDDEKYAEYIEYAKRQFTINEMTYKERKKKLNLELNKLE